MKYEQVSRPFRAPLLAAMAVAASLLVAPLVSAVIDLPTIEPAYAKGGKGGGGGQGGGHGGGHGGGNSANSGQSGGVSAGKGSGLGHDKARGLGHSKGHGTSTASEVDGISASALGRLNAAHASQRARDRAAEHSAVGRIADYQAAFSADGVDIEAAAEALAAAANKPIDSDVVGAVNGLLGIDSDTATDDAIAAAAAALQAPEAPEAVEEEGGDPVQ